MLGPLASGSAHGEIGARLNTASEQILRGRSISAGRPVAGLDLSYDDQGGVYVGAQATGVATRHDGARGLSLAEYGGFAWRVDPALTLDIGASNTQFSRFSSLGRGAHYSEITLGAIGRRLSGRVSLSPNWFGPRHYTGYGELSAMLGDPAGWQVSLHGGVLTWLHGTRPVTVARTRYDARVGVGRDFGRVHGEAAWSTTGPQPDFYAGRARGRGTLVVSASVRL